MNKRYLLALVLAALPASIGCRMCCPSYDYCGPTNPGESQCESCGMARRGSLFSGAGYAEQGTYETEGEIVEGDEGVVFEGAAAQGRYEGVQTSAEEVLPPQ